MISCIKAGTLLYQSEEFYTYEYDDDDDDDDDDNNNNNNNVNTFKDYLL